MIDVRFLCYEDLDKPWPSENWSNMFDFFFIDKVINKDYISALKKDRVIIIDESEYIIIQIKFDVDNHIFYCEVFPNYEFKKI